MTRSFFVFFWLCLIGFQPSGLGQGFGFAGGKGPSPVKVELVAEVEQAVAGQPFRVAVKVIHEPTWHIYGKVLPPEVIGKPTVLEWTLPEGWQVEDLPWPKTHVVPSTDGATSEGYDGTVYLPALIIPSGSATGQVEISVVVNALACDPKSCVPVKPSAKMMITLAGEVRANAALGEVFAELDAVAAAADDDGGKDGVQSAAAAPVRSFAAFLLFAFLGGLILNIMPCVFPVLGIKIMSVVKQAGEDRRQVVLHGVAYTLGILVCFWALGLLVVTVGKSWGFQLQSPGFVYALGTFFLVFGLNMAGVFEIGASAVGVGADLQSKQGLGGSFFTGLLATVVATPCSAPFLGSALAFAVTLAAPQALLMFSMIGLGLASPFLLLSLFPKLVSALPRPGAWMESFKQGMSFLLFGTVGYMIWVLTGMVEGLPLLFGFFGLVVVALGCWIYGRWALPHKPARTRWVANGLALGAVVAGLWMGWPRPEEKWQEWSPERVAELQKANVPVYVDFTAKWCFTCQVNKRVYGSPAIKRAIAEKKIVLLKADWTNEDPRITAALAELGKAAVPVNVLYLPGETQPRILDELDGLLTEDLVLKAFGEIPGS